MHITSIDILNYKNIKEATLEFSNSLNCIVGNNGEGKTNLLDSIYYLSFCKSHTNLIDSQNINHGENFFFIKANLNTKNKNHKISCGVKIHKKKSIKWDNEEYTKLSEHIGKIPLIIVCPQDEELIREGSNERRRFMDMAISLYDKQYISDLIKYNNILKQRNALLKNNNISDNSLYDLYDQGLEQYGIPIYTKRKKFIDEFIPVFQEYYNKISNNKEKINLTYNSHLQETPLYNQLKETLRKDTILGYTTRGVHKDDLIMTIGGYPIKKIGSQGQSKSFLIAMKLAQFSFLKKNTGKTPILLLDDLFDKLDLERVSNIINLVSGNDFGQIFISDTNLKNLDKILNLATSDYKIFDVKDGKITENI